MKRIHPPPGILDLEALAKRLSRGTPAFCLAAGSLPGRGLFTRETHIHDSWELKFAVSKGMTVRFPGWSVSLSAPACCLIAPGTPHETSLSKDVPRSGQGYVVCQEASLVEFGPVDTRADRERSELSQVQLAELQEELGNPLDRFMEHLTSGLKRFSEPVPDEHARARLVYFVGALARAIARTPDKGQESPLRIVERAEDYMRGRYFDPEVTVADVASAVGRTPTHLATLFRKHRDRTVRETLVNIRLQKAGAFLRSGSYTVKEVSYLTGWGSPYYFSNCFQHSYGRRPSFMRDPKRG